MRRRRGEGRKVIGTSEVTVPPYPGVDRTSLAPLILRFAWRDESKTARNSSWKLADLVVLRVMENTTSFDRRHHSRVPKEKHRPMALG
jgi:hypothetical protein